MVVAVETKTARRKRERAERLAQQAVVARESGHRSLLDVARESERNRAFGETCSTYWMEEHVAHRAIWLSSWVQRVQDNLARQQRELAKPAPDNHTLGRLRTEAERLRVREVFPDTPCQCRACVKRQGGAVVRQRRWPAIYVGSAGKSYECFLEKHATDDLDHSQSWSTSSPTVASLEYARRAQENGKPVRPQKPRRLPTEDAKRLALEAMRQHNRMRRDVRRLILRQFFAEERLLREVVGAISKGTPRDVERALKGLVRDGQLVWVRGRYRVPLSIEEHAERGMIVKAAG